MNIGHPRESAQIIPFPVRQRRAGEAQDTSRVTLEQPAPGVARVACGGSWYHEAAIEESVRTAKR